MKQLIPLFFAVDDNYIPFLAVALKSIKGNASNSYSYLIHILHTGVNKRSEKKIMKLSEEDFAIRFYDVSSKLEELANRLHLRDYYTCTTYYRIFIAEMFPEYDKALYLDSDTVTLGDISELFNHDLGGNLIGAITDETVFGEDVFRHYVKNALGIEPEKYFNAGIILMNLKLFREENFYAKFTDLLGKYKFTVAQDQDYLNVLCKDRVLYIESGWNKMPIPGSAKTPKLIHYNLTRKPWHYSNVPYQQYFWEYAAKTDFYKEILRVRKAFTPEHAERDALCERNLLALALQEARSACNYFRLFACAR